MQDEIWPFVEPFGKPVSLPRYLRFDNWEVSDALLLLMGVCPEDRYFSIAQKSGAIVGVFTLNARRRKASDDNELEFVDLRMNQQMMKAVWDSGSHPDRNPPRYYVEWAIRKGFVVPWLPWAEEYGLTDIAANPSGTTSAIGKVEGSNSRHLSSDKLAKLNQAAGKFWANADRNDRETHPKKADVVEWLVRRGFSETLADSAATIIRPEWAPTGRKPEK